MDARQEADERALARSRLSNDCIGSSQRDPHSGGPYALAAARALRAHSDLDAPQIAEQALRIAAGICVYTNDQITVLTL